MSCSKSTANSERSNIDGETSKYIVEKNKPLRISTETSTFFLLPRFDSIDTSYQERLPKNFKEFESLLNKIYSNLEETESVFRNQVKELVNRDVKLVRFRFKLENLHQCLEAKRKFHGRLDRSVLFILNLTNDLHNIVSRLEKELLNSSAIANGIKFTPDRMNMYDFIFKMNLKQKDMMQQISDTITAMNDMVGKNPADPLGKITRILNLHTEAFGLIERKISQVEEQLGKVNSMRDCYINTQNQTLSGQD